MDAKELGRSRILNLLFWPAGKTMESPLRRLLHDPERILRGACVAAGQTVLEVGSGTGFFTIPAARMIGDKGRLIAMEPLRTYARRLKRKAAAAGLGNIEVLRRDALDTGLVAASVDRILLFGVLPFPTLPLARLLPEMHRVLKPGGRLALWMFPVDGSVPGAIAQSDFFDPLGAVVGVHSYRPSPPASAGAPE